MRRRRRRAARRRFSRALLERAPFERALLTHNAVRPKTKARTYKVVARVAGKQPFRREDLEAPFIAALGALLPRWTPSGGAGRDRALGAGRRRT